MTLSEPGGYSTGWGGISARHATTLPASDSVREQASNRPPPRHAREPGTNTGGHPHPGGLRYPPLRVFFGQAPLAVTTADNESRLKTWNEGQPLSLAAHGAQPPDRPAAGAVPTSTD